MKAYQPRIAHVISVTFLCVLFAYLWSVTMDNTASAMKFASALFFVLDGAVTFSLMESSHYWAVTNYIEALIKLDPDLRNALALRVPALRLVATRGHVVRLFENTQATEDHIVRFLQDSKPEHTASRRDWHTAERPAWAYEEIYQYLLDREMISPFAVGPESYAWIGKSFHNMCIYLLSKPLPNLGLEGESHA